VTETGVAVAVLAIKETIEVADLVESARLLTVTITSCAALMVAGAVYKPSLEIVPTCGLSDHAIRLLELPLT